MSNERWRDEAGASLVEYALLVALIALVCVAGITTFGGANGASLDDSSSQIDDAFGG